MRLTFRLFLTGYFAGVLLALPLHAQPGPANPAYPATAWATLTVKLMTRAPRNTPTYGSRALGYIGLTMYETVVGRNGPYRSVARQLCDTLRLPKCPPQRTYNPALALNAGQAYMLKALYGYTKNTAPIDSLEAHIRTVYAAQTTPKTVARSEAYGRAVAEVLYQWSLRDGGHEGYDRNFPSDHVTPVGAGLWSLPAVVQSGAKFPMHPTWGQNRTFVPANARLPLPQPVPFSTDTTSPYYKMLDEVLQCGQHLGEAERETVMWWGDDPTLTCSPPGHSYNLATVAVRQTNPDLVRATQTYCRVGMAVADAFTVCWKTKFTYNVERPSTFIGPSLLKPYSAVRRWNSFFLEPPFPAFYSGHATQSAATAAVMTDLYGPDFAFTDSTHVGREPMNYGFNRHIYTLTFKPRTYASFWAAAYECAESRLLGGIHTRHDNDIGLAEGTKIGNAVNGLRWK